MKLSHLALIVILSAGTAFAVGRYAPAPSVQNETKKETAFERVMRTGTLRCGYLLYPEVLERDITTGKFSGLDYDVVEEIGKRLGLKIEWTEEVGFATLFEGLKTGRYDAVCTSLYTNPSRARAAEFLAPSYYAPYYAYVRADDTRFDNNLKSINDPSVRVVVLDGEMSQTVTNEDFPKASILSMPNMTDASQVLLQVTTGKADVALTIPATANTFIEQNPSKLKRVAGSPVRLMAASLSVGVGEEELKSLLNTTIETLHSTGFIKRTFIKTPKSAETYYLPAQPWRRDGD